MKKLLLFSVAKTLALIVVLILMDLGEAASKGKPGGSTTTPNAALVYRSDFNVFVSNLDGSLASKVISDVSVFVEPSWTADGNGFLIIYNNGLYFQAFDNASGVVSGSPLLITASANLQFRPEMSPVPAPDGNYKIVYTEAQPNGTYDLFLINLDGSGKTRLTETDSLDETKPHWAPTGDRLVVDTFDSSSGAYVEILDLGINLGTGQIEIVSRTNLTAGLAEFPLAHGPFWPIWSSDGLSVIASGQPATSLNHDLFGIPLSNPAALINLTTSPDVHESVSTLSPDGSQIMVRHKGADSCGTQKGKAGQGIHSFVIRNVNGTPIGSCDYNIAIKDAGGLSIPDWK